MYDKTIIVGHLGNNAELRYSPEGVPVCSFSLATNTGYGDSKTTKWYRVTCWRKLAESLSPYLKRGGLVLVEGVLQADPNTGGPKIWTRQDGSAGASFELTAREIRLLGRKEEERDGEEIPF